VTPAPTPYKLVVTYSWLPNKAWHTLYALECGLPVQPQYCTKAGRTASPQVLRIFGGSWGSQGTVSAATLAKLLSWRRNFVTHVGLRTV